MKKDEVEETHHHQLFILAREECMRRRFLVLWRTWLHLTAPVGTENYSEEANADSRERLRRAGLISAIGLLILLSPLLLLQQALVSPQTTLTGLALGILSMIALYCNRKGWQTGAALILVLSIDGLIEAALLSAPGGLGSGWLLTFDLFVFPLLLAGVLLAPSFIWFFISLHIALILSDFYGLPHSADLAELILHWGGPAVAYARPILLQISCGVLSVLEVRSTNEAIRRADRAEEIARLQQSIAQEKQQLEQSIQQIQQAIVQAANGRIVAQPAVTPDDALWQIAASLQLLFGRVSKVRELEQAMRLMTLDIARLTEAVHQTRTRQSTIWPLPSGSELDPLIRELRLAAGLHNPPGQYNERKRRRPFPHHPPSPTSPPSEPQDGP